MLTPVKDVMTKNVVTVDPDTPLKEVVALLRRHQISAVPVVDAGQVLGVVSEDDLLLKDEEPGIPAWHPLAFTRRGHRVRRAMQARTARDVMTTPVRTVDEQTTAAQAARIMRSARIKRLVVTGSDDHHMVGIVTRLDLLAVFQRPDEEIRRDIFDYVIGRAVVTPRDFSLSGRDRKFVWDGHAAAGTWSRRLMRSSRSWRVNFQSKGCAVAL